ncbi:MAG: glycolate oxidase subunit GlcF [Rubripirellula sp.]|jgi:glycolate oxidase iron-sulfur subunit|nr:glycolate oxidase subunit GlcF [Rubripirellula sp.]
MLHDIKPEEHPLLGQEMAEAVSTCVHCGFCLAACPTYKELGQEADSPRGRIVLMKEVLEGKLELEAALPHIDPCLGCLACEPACPSGVPYRDLISPFRAQSESKRQRPLIQRVTRWMTQFTLPYPKRFRLAAKTGKLAKPLSFMLPNAMRVMLDLLPPQLPKQQAWKENYPAIGSQRARVALLTGCAQSVLDPDINTATIEVLNQNGVEVVVPKNQACCGALSWHVGNLPQARQFASQNVHAFPEDVDAIVTNAAGCGSGMHEYHLILKGTADEAKADAFRHRVQDVAAFLTQLGDLKTPPDPGRKMRIAYHDACHLANAQGVRSEPRHLLRMIPGVELCEISDAHLCCGSAGTYNIDQPEIAASLGKQKASNVVATGAEIVATGNIGCMTQLSNHLTKQASEIQVRHTMQVLRDAYLGNKTN